MYELRCLGEASLRDPSGALLHFRSRKHFALLTYLALNADRAHRRERLAGLLWSDSDDSRARHSLSQALYAVRRLLNNAVRIEGEDLELESTGLRVDAIELERLFRAGEARAAADLYRGDFLEGFWLRGARGFEEWSGREKARVGALAREALREAIRSARESCEWAEVRSRAERLIQLDPFDEAAYAELMRALWMLGDRAAALERYDALERVLAAELETAPAPETVALAERIRKRPVRGGWGNRPLLRECENPAFLDPPFVGRKAELAALAEEWARVERGESRTVVLIGDAGIGKTRLAEEFIRSLELSDVCVLRGRCYEVEQTLPYGPVAEALREGLDALELSEVAPLWLAELARIVPEVSERVGELPVPAVLDAEGGRRRLYEGIAQVLRAACEARPMLLFVDDLHWADDSSLALLHYLHRRVTNGFYLLTAHRPEEIDESTDVFPEKWVRTSAIRSVRISKLQEGESNTLLMSLLSGISDTTRIDSLRLLSGGHPFFAIELARSLKKESQGRELQKPTVSDTICTLLDRRFAKLSHQALGLLLQAACLGSRCHLDVLLASSRMSAFDFDQVLTELVKSGLITEEKIAIQFRHDLIREVAWTRVRDSGRAVLHTRAARALIQLKRKDAEIAYHLAESGDSRRAFAYSLRAADGARLVFAFQEAAGLLQQAIRHAPTKEAQSDLMGQLGRVFFHLREYAEARPLLSRRLEYLQSQNASLRAQYEARSDLLFVDVYSGRLTVDESCRALKTLYSELQHKEIGDQRLEVQLLCSLFWASARSFNPHLAEMTVIEIRKLHSRIDRPDLLCRTGRSLGIYERYKGNLKAAETLLREALLKAQEAKDEVAEIDCYVGLTLLLPRSLDDRLAEEVLQSALPVAEHHADPARIASLLCNCAACYMYLGQIDRAAALLKKAKQTLETHNAVPDTAASVWYNLGFVEHARGDEEQAEMCWKLALLLSDEAGVLPVKAECLAALGIQAYRRSNLTEARRFAAQGLRLARKGRFLVDQLFGLEELLARLRHESGHKRKALQSLSRVAETARTQDMPLYLTALLTQLELLVTEGHWIQAKELDKQIREIARSLDSSWWGDRVDRVAKTAGYLADGRLKSSAR